MGSCYTSIVMCIYSGYGEEILRYWKQLDQSPNVMATQYYTVLRSIEEKQDGEYWCDSVIMKEFVLHFSGVHRFVVTPREHWFVPRRSVLHV